MAVGDQNTLEQLLRVLSRRWKIIVVCVLASVGAAVGLSLRQPREYTASASILFRDPGFDQKLFGNSSFTNTDPSREAATNIYLVSLPIIASRTAAALHLPKYGVRSEVSLSGAGEADVAQISATDRSPALAATIANTYAAQYTMYVAQADRAKADGARKLVQSQLAALSPGEREGPVGQALQKYSNDLALLAALQTGNAQLAQPATVPTSPSSPRPKHSALLGGLLGLLLGMGLVFVIERLDRRIKDSSDLQSAYDVKILGSVPTSRSIALAGTHALPAADAEAFSLIRARLRYFNVERELRSVVITSAFPKEGKTTVALNLAIAEAVAGNTNVVLLEADFRNPTLAVRLGMRPIPGLGEILAKGATLETIEAAVRRVRVPGVAAHDKAAPSFNVITAGWLPPNPVEMIESRPMVDLLVTLSERFDLIIVDTAPASVVPDAIPLMRLVSGTIIASRLGVITRDAASQLGEQLKRLDVPALGLIVNGASTRNGKLSADYYRHGLEGTSLTWDGAELGAEDAAERPGGAAGSAR